MVFGRPSIQPCLPASDRAPPKSLQHINVKVRPRNLLFLSQLKHQLQKSSVSLQTPLSLSLLDHSSDQRIQLYKHCSSFIAGLFDYRQLTKHSKCALLPSSPLLLWPWPLLRALLPTRPYVFFHVSYSRKTSNKSRSLSSAPSPSLPASLTPMDSLLTPPKPILSVS